MPKIENSDPSSLCQILLLVNENCENKNFMNLGNSFCQEIQGRLYNRGLFRTCNLVWKITSSTSLDQSYYLDNSWVKTIGHSIHIDALFQLYTIHKNFLVKINLSQDLYNQIMFDKKYRDFYLAIFLNIERKLGFNHLLSCPIEDKSKEEKGIVLSVYNYPSKDLTIKIGHESFIEIWEILDSLNSKSFLNLREILDILASPTDFTYLEKRYPNLFFGLNERIVGFSLRNQKYHNEGNPTYSLRNAEYGTYRGVVELLSLNGVTACFFGGVPEELDFCSEFFNFTGLDFTFQLILLDRIDILIGTRNGFSDIASVQNMKMIVTNNAPKKIEWRQDVKVLNKEMKFKFVPTTSSDITEFEIHTLQNYLPKYVEIIDNHPNQVKFFIASELGLDI
jgi:hypothetical protein